jgi:hypothetical protein
MPKLKAFNDAKCKILYGKRLGDYKSTDSPLPPLLNVMYCVSVSLCLSLRNTKEMGS